jgi:hypothetical protein
MANPTFFLSREAEHLASARELRRKHAAGLLTRVVVGVYMDRAEWTALDADARYRARVRATALTSPPGTQFSHDSAAAMLRLPSVQPWPVKAHQLTDRGPGGTSNTLITRHGMGLDRNTLDVDGVTVTSLVRTLIDMSCTTPFVRAVAMVDDGLRPPRRGDPRWAQGVPAVTKEDLLTEMESLRPYRGLVKAAAAIGFANSLSGSPAESFGRVQFHALGLPTPELQVGFSDEWGLIGFADFYWRELDLIVEVDGRSKYGAGRRYQTGMSIEEIMLAEKHREDRMRRVVSSFARLSWPQIQDRRALGAYLRSFGLVAERRAPSEAIPVP